jgi:hypothetical protein
VSGCPNSTESGCRCSEHHPGLREFARDTAAFDAVLAVARQPVRLEVVTMPVRDDDACDGSMTCACVDCIKDRVGRQRQQVRQPWEPRPAGRRSAA